MIIEVVGKLLKEVRLPISEAKLPKIREKISGQKAMLNKNPQVRKIRK
jgi:hypothetical protein